MPGLSIQPTIDLKRQEIQKAFQDILNGLSGIFSEGEEGQQQKIKDLLTQLQTKADEAIQEVGNQQTVQINNPNAVVGVRECDDDGKDGVFDSSFWTNKLNRFLSAITPTPEYRDDQYEPNAVAGVRGCEDDDTKSTMPSPIRRNKDLGE